MTRDVQFMLGEIMAKQELILEELRNQRQKVEALQFKVYTWSGGLAMLVVAWPVVKDKIFGAIGLS